MPPTPMSADSCLPEGFRACPARVALDTLGSKWTLLILRNLLRGERRFNDLAANIPGLTPKLLSDRLKDLQRAQLVRRRVTPSSPVRVEYELTPRGRGVYPVLRSLAAWSLAWAPEAVVGGARGVKVEAELRRWEALFQGRPA